MRVHLIIMALTLSACVHAEPPRVDIANAKASFDSAVTARASELTIPGIAYAVVQDGAIVSRGEIATGSGAALTVDSPLRLASVTKAFTAVLMMRAVERDLLSLDDSLARWNANFADRPQIHLNHVAAHVSEGEVGREYVYSTSRYSMLGDVLAQAYGAQTYEAVLRRELIEPLGMTWRDSPDLGAHAGLVSTVNDVGRFVGALQRGELISAQSFQAMTTPYQAPDGPTPVGVGWFSQVIGGERVVWSFGQDDPDHSSALVLMLPERDLALVMLANTDELSNPFRLLMGDIRYSPFATAFLDAYAPNIGAAIEPRQRAISDLLSAIYREDMEAASRQFADIAALGAPGSDDLVLHFAAGLTASEATSAYAHQLDRAVLSNHPNNRWALLLSGGLNTRLGDTARAQQSFETLLALPNQERDGLNTLFRAWAYQGLAGLHADDPVRALAYIEEGLATGVTGGTRDSLLAMRASLSEQ